MRKTTEGEFWGWEGEGRDEMGGKSEMGEGRGVGGG